LVRLYKFYVPVFFTDRFGKLTMFTSLFLRIKHNMAKDKTGTITFYDGSELLIKKGQTGDLEVTVPGS